MAHIARSIIDLNSHAVTGVEEYFILHSISSIEVTIWLLGSCKFPQQSNKPMWVSHVGTEL